MIARDESPMRCVSQSAAVSFCHRPNNMGASMGRRTRQVVAFWLSMISTAALLGCGQAAYEVNQQQDKEIDSQAQAIAKDCDEQMAKAELMQAPNAAIRPGITTLACH